MISYEEFVQHALYGRLKFKGCTVYRYRGNTYSAGDYSFAVTLQTMFAAYTNNPCLFTIDYGSRSKRYDKL